MITLRQDPLVNAVRDGIVGDVRVALATESWRAAVILTFAGMDTMAYLDLPPERIEVGGPDFIAWSERYIRLPGLLQLTGRDMWGARCGIVHTYGSASRLSRRREARHLLYK